MYQIVISRSGNNPLTGKPQYRVIYCFYVFNQTAFININGIKTRALKGIDHLVILLKNPRKVGTLINPTKALFNKEESPNEIHH